MSYDLMFQHAINLHENGKLDEAEQLYRQILETAPNNSDVLNLLGLIAQAKGIHIEAIDYFYKAIKNSPNHYPFYFNLAVSLNIWGKPHEAIDAYQKVIALKPDIKEANNNIGNIYKELNDNLEARKYYQKALEIAPDYFEAEANLIMTYLEEDKEKTLNDLLNLQTRYPQSELICYFLAEIFYKDNLYHKALSYINLAYQINPFIDEIMLLKGRIMQGLEDEKTAQELFAKTLMLNPDNIPALIFRANYLTNNEEYMQAEANYKRVIELDKYNLDAHINYANLLYLQKRTQEALEEYRQAVLINPKIAEVSNNLGLILKDVKEYEEALGLFFNAFKLKPELEAISININETLILYSQAGHKDEAVKIAANWLKDSPKNIFAQHTAASLKGEVIEDNKIYNEKLFDNFADNYELVLERINYQLPSRIRDIAGNVKGTIVDLGCGSGLVGEALKTDSTKLIGIDISEKMLEKAQRKGIYQELIKSDIKKYLQQNIKADLIVAADVFCYLGSLDEIIKLCQNNKLCFSIEVLENSTKDFIVAETGRYKHKPEYIEKILRDCGYHKIEKHPLILRKENDNDVKGIVFLAE